ncbi:CASP-like protein 2A1 [Canna indica]|uniref:CASP-like protein n=1 Tax=Canna indica TaxID=4628 RepID=A0AAQ3JNE1_9LILI|nr:CASP-like protein 2A1 [Canna indica]
MSEEEKRQKKPAGGEDAGTQEEGSGPVEGRAAETLLRLVSLGLCLAALAIMLKNAEDGDFGAISYADLAAFKLIDLVLFSESPLRFHLIIHACMHTAVAGIDLLVNMSNRYLVYSNGVCAAYSLFSAFCVAMLRPTTLSRSWTFFIFDQVLAYVILAAGAVSAEIVYLAYNGDEKVTWSKECVAFGSFCRRAMTSVGITFASVACYMLLSLASSYRLFSAYQPFIPSLNSNSLEIASSPR